MTSRRLIIVLAVLAFACGVFAVGWRVDHQRLDCYRDAAEEQLVADSDCERFRLR